MLHTAVLHDLLDDEVAVASDRLAGRFLGLARQDDDVVCRFRASDDATYRLRLEGRSFDAEPFRIAVLHDAGAPLPGASWPPGLLHSQHPVLGIPWACVQGTYEYHTYPGHEADVWDRYRHRVRLADLLDHLLKRCGA